MNNIITINKEQKRKRKKKIKKERKRIEYSSTR